MALVVGVVHNGAFFMFLGQKQLFPIILEDYFHMFMRTQVSQAKSII